MEKTAANSAKTDHVNLCRFIPQVVHYESSNECIWGVQAFLPAEEYRRFLQEVAKEPSKMDGLRAFFDEKVNTLLEGTLKPGSKILVGWSPTRGAYFSFENSCGVGVDGEDTLSRYTSSNVDSPQQALPLLACLTLYMRHILAEMEGNDLYRSIPDFSKGGGWGLKLKLPEECAELLPLISGDKEFREGVETELKELFNGTLKDTWVKVTWASDGAAFYTAGNACEVRPGSDLSYDSFNVDTAKQALTFYTCLTVYARRLFGTLAYKTEYPDGPIKEVSSTVLNFDPAGNFETERVHVVRIAKDIRRRRAEP